MVLVSSVKSETINNEIFECVNIGETCSSFLSACKGGSCQYQNSTYGEPFALKICSNLKKINEFCFDDTDCEFGLSCDYLGDNTCKEFSYLSLGEKCDSSKQCIGQLECKNSICTNTSNQCCLYQCQSEYYCNIYDCDEFTSRENCPPLKCAPSLNKGEYCKNDAYCKLGLICGIDNLCVEKYSYQLNEKCDEFDEFKQCDIGKSLICHNGLCVKRNESFTNDCVKDNCEFGHEICDVNTGKCSHYSQIFSQKCKLAESKRNSCLVQNKCSYVNGMSDNLGKNSCQMNHCLNETIDYLNQCKSTFSKKTLCNK